MQSELFVSINKYGDIAYLDQKMVRLLKVGPSRWDGVPLLRAGEPAPPEVKSPILPGHSSFKVFFQPILGSLAGYWWYNPPLYGPHASTDIELQKAWQSITDDDWAPPGLLLPRFAHHMQEDWCECLGFLEKPTHSMPVFNSFATADPLFQHCDLAFQNVDGAFWYMYSRDSQLTRIVESYLKSIPGAEVEWGNVDVA